MFKIFCYTIKIFKPLKLHHNIPTVYCTMWINPLTTRLSYPFSIGVDDERCDAYVFRQSLQLTSRLYIIYYIHYILIINTRIL